MSFSEWKRSIKCDSGVGEGQKQIRFTRCASWRALQNDVEKRAMTEGPESRFGSADHLMLPKGLYSGGIIFGLVLILSSLFLNFLF
jgi:hypothetical protein